MLSEKDLLVKVSVPVVVAKVPVVGKVTPVVPEVVKVTEWPPEVTRSPAKLIVLAASFKVNVRVLAAPRFSVFLIVTS